MFGDGLGLSCAQKIAAFLSAVGFEKVLYFISHAACAYSDKQKSVWRNVFGSDHGTALNHDANFSGMDVHETVKAAVFLFQRPESLAGDAPRTP